jgi:hypothetical protein
MQPSVREIEAAVDRLKASPGRFQHLCERVISVLYPIWFGSYSGYGRSTRDVPLGGWPDAYALRSDGRLDALEVTHNDRWLRHINDDIEKIRALGQRRVAGFTFIAWAHNPGPEKLLELSQTITGLGVEPDSLNFIFRERLVSILTEARFASVRLEFLGIHTSFEPFQTVEEADHLFGGPDLFGPSIDEFRKCLVHQSGLTVEVEAALTKHRWALVRGGGASGKTILAIQIAMSGEHVLARSLYLDIAMPELGGWAVADIFDAISTYAENGVLFIVDNVHVNEKLTRRLFDHWRDSPNGSEILLLGRRTYSAFPLRGTQSDLAALDFAALELVPTGDDFAGVYARLWKKVVTNEEPPRPPESVLDFWRDAFAGDLIAFSSALAGYLARDGRIRLKRSDWRLPPEAAISYVREFYVNPERNEIDNLLRIAALATIEFAAPEEVLDFPVLAHSLREGVIQRIERGRERHRSLRLHHHQLGQLILRGGTKQDSAAIIADTALRSPFYGVLIAARLAVLGRHSEARAILLAIAENPEYLERALLDGPASYVGIAAERLQTL